MNLADDAHAATSRGAGEVGGGRTERQRPLAEANGISPIGAP
jgi:hypothetical protein